MIVYYTSQQKYRWPERTWWSRFRDPCDHKGKVTPVTQCSIQRKSAEPIKRAGRGRGVLYEGTPFRRSLPV